ncbi:intimin-like inverse autotransporter SinH [Escherichia coli]|uniref:intimin-like inverse autotransporter SinH n=1 Tax=Escherichia coli TaxID=562 RepID=UPI0003EF7834|nr:intimin-like inverse autotransporter SinH [Escherichia coli]EEW3525062.1 intimin-like inverse autotransporter SinH [Escherichia coli]EFC7082939.1 intimin-like inverse autotransporter SinH [Escherichia coli]EFF2654615.1 intimin-like inverse autotransporter SinH [Escherichia coli]EFH6970165.1 intimin-like inverse autotransporter SinH [Escherichia coli]EFJ8644025.1 intimin-like inverse autotransporter SinH [Escherichia coli]
MLRWSPVLFSIMWASASWASEGKVEPTNISSTDSPNTLPDLGSSEKSNSKDEKGALGGKAQGYFISSATQGFENLTPEALKAQAESYAKGQVTSTAQSYLENVLSPYGSVRTSLSIGEGGDLDGSTFDYFVPWYDNQETLVFSQFSAQRKDDRTIGNIGVGVRQNIGNWLLGGNLFYDYDFTRGHRRLGLGSEAWTDYLKFSGNYYHPLSDWKDSKDFDFYEERPARGWDVRAEGWLPAWPQFGAKLVYEQYYGDEVALFGTDNLEKNPQALTVGLMYNPVPLFTVGSDYKSGTGDNSDLSVNVSLNYQIGTPLKDQLDPDNVKAKHSLMGSRHDFVERNNFIVLEYREKDPLDVTLWLKADTANEHPECIVKDTPELAVGLEKCKWTINALINNHYKIVAASWQAKNNANRTLVMPVVKANALTEGNNNRWNLVLPAWQSASTKEEQEKVNTWRVRLALEDEKGNRQNSGVVEIVVKQDRKIELIVNHVLSVPADNNHSYQAEAKADGSDGVVMDMHITDSFGDNTDKNGNTLPETGVTPTLYDENDKKVTLNTKPCVTETPCVFIAKRDKEKGTITLSSTLPGTFRWKVKAEPYSDSNFVDVTFTNTANVGGINGFIYRLEDSSPKNLAGDAKPIPLKSGYRFVMWRDSNNDGIYQQSEKLTEEEKTRYDYEWEFTGKSAHGSTGAKANTINEDLILPATNKEAASKFDADERDGVQGYGIRVVYSEKQKSA